MLTHNALGALISLGAANRGETEARAALQHRESFVRAVAVQLLAELRGSRPVERGLKRVRALLVREQDRGVRSLAGRALRVLEAKRE